MPQERMNKREKEIYIFLMTTVFFSLSLSLRQQQHTEAAFSIFFSLLKLSLYGNIINNYILVNKKENEKRQIYFFSWRLFLSLFIMVLRWRENFFFFIVTETFESIHTEK